MANRGWGDLFGLIASWLPGKEEARRNEYEKLREEKKKILAKPPTQRSRVRLAVINKRMRDLTESAINQ